MLKGEEIIVASLEELRGFAEKLAAEINDGEAVALIGNLGAGKTTLTRMICEEWNIGEVDSPSFAIINEYYGDKRVYHFDFYRIVKERELYDIGITEYFNDMEAIKFIEWADLFPDVLPNKRIEIKMQLLEDDRRKISFKKHE